MSGRTDQDSPQHWVDGAPPPLSSRPPAPPASPVLKLTPDQIIRAEALRCATSGGPRDPENAIRDAKRYAAWIKEGS